MPVSGLEDWYRASACRNDAVRGEIGQHRSSRCRRPWLTHIGFVSQSVLLLGDVGIEGGSSRVSLYLASMAPQAEKSQHVPPN